MTTQRYFTLNPIPDDWDDELVQAVRVDLELAWLRRYSDVGGVITSSQLEEQHKVNGEWLFPEDQYHRHWRVVGTVNA